MKFHIYCRVSRKEQAEGVSLEDQESRARKYLEAVGHEVAKVYRDAGISGSMDPEERPAMGRMLASLGAKEADGFAVASLDRMSRSVRHTFALIESLNERGLGLVSVKDSVDLSTASGRMFLGMLGTFHQFTREVIVEKTKEALQHLRDTGRVYSGVMPWGYRRDGASDRMVVDLGERLCLSLTREFLTSNPTASGPAVAAHLEKNFGRHPRTGLAWTAEAGRRMKARAIEASMEESVDETQPGDGEMGEEDLPLLRAAEQPVVDAPATGHDEGLGCAAP